MRYPSLKPPFICPWKTEGCTHVTLTSREDHKKHIAQHEEQLRRGRVESEAKRSNPPRTRKFIYTFPRKRGGTSQAAKTQSRNTKETQ